MIALVVTIILLIILATISFNLLFRDTGIIKRAQMGQGVHEQAQELERLELVKGIVAIDNMGKVSIANYLKEAIAGGITTAEDIEEQTETSATFTTDNGYVVTITQDGPNNILINIEGKNGAIKPRITNMILTPNEENTAITVNVDLNKAEGVTLKYYYKTEGGEYGEPIYEGTNTSYTIEGLTEGETYIVKVEAANEHGTTEKEESRILGKVTQISDGVGGTIPLPDEFYYVGGTLETGIVISDKQGDTMDASGIDSGNQFVWIPVKNEEDLTITLFDSNGKPTEGLDTTVYTEPYSSGYATEATEYNTMKQQVLKYGGFYIGRYEAGVNSTTLRTKVTTAQEVVSKKGVAPYNYVPWGKAMNDASEVSGQSGAVYLAQNMYNFSDSVTSTLCYGGQWDAMCRYVGANLMKAPTKSAAELTGSAEMDVSKNIYDLAGNCVEWTMETYQNKYRMRRGGAYNYQQLIYNRSGGGSYETTYSSSGNSFRVALYIK